MSRVAVVGASGFVGRATVAALSDSGSDVIQLRAPRLATAARLASDLQQEAESRARHGLPGVDLRGIDVVVNCSGMADATGRKVEALLGANALLPGALAFACRYSGVKRFIHISSAAVQGRRPRLDESESCSPFSDYSTAKALGEYAIPRGPDMCILRPTSVHGPRRPLTRRLIRLARSPFAFIAGDGNRPTPQVHIANVAAAVTLLASLDTSPPRVVLQPSEGWTARSFLAFLGGKEPHRVPEGASRRILDFAYSMAPVRPGLAGNVRRLEMMMYGQSQDDGWLVEVGFKPVAGERQWQALLDEALAGVGL